MLGEVRTGEQSVAFGEVGADSLGDVTTIEGVRAAQCDGTQGLAEGRRADSLAHFERSPGRSERGTAGLVQVEDWRRHDAPGRQAFGHRKAALGKLDGRREQVGKG